MEIKRDGKNTLIKDICPDCKQERWVRLSRMGSICKNCRLRNLNIKRGLNWRGGQTISGGYVMIYMPNHPYSHKSGYIKRSHLIMEREIGRYIMPYEDVHHKNGVKDDDSPENLEVMTHGKHTAETNHKLNKAQHMMLYRW